MGYMEDALDSLTAEGFDAASEIVTAHKGGAMPFHAAYDILIELELEPEVALHMLHPPMEAEWSANTHSVTSLLGNEEEE
tara:strand:- start:212 stop:451 length:240 start_codon:yes stop_codon:yes gene_type:complete